MTYTFDQLKEDVKKEAEALRVHATKEERQKLSHEHLRPTNASRCIYGLMTANCYSYRAVELIDKCAIKHFDYLPETINELKQLVVDKPKGFISDRVNRIASHSFSAIEAYIVLSEARNANLIAYLRGETETLDL